MGNDVVVGVPSMTTHSWELHRGPWGQEAVWGRIGLSATIWAPMGLYGAIRGAG